jgi:hypothetical protein
MLDALTKSRCRHRKNQCCRRKVGIVSIHQTVECDEAGHLHTLPSWSCPTDAPCAPLLLAESAVGVVVRSTQRFDLCEVANSVVNGPLN